MKIGNRCIIPGHVKIGMDGKVYDILYDIIDIKEEENKIFVKVKDTESEYTGWYCEDKLIEIIVYHKTSSMFVNMIDYLKGIKL